MATIDEQEKEIVKFWKKNKTFEKSLEKTKKGKPYIFYDGPPFATGLPHYGHILASTIKDAIPRFWTMKGRFVKRVWGWDCHGLPVENIAEKELGIKTKDEIEKMGVAKFNAFCRSKVLTYAGEWGKTVERIGRWIDFENSYKTMDNEYIESVWWAFKELYKKDYIYKGEKVLMYCTRCGTPMASSEVAMDQSYRTITEDTITVKFKLKDEDAYALAWTTTPWTLPSNLALAVNPNLRYAYLKDLSDNTIYVLGKDTISRYFKSPKDYKIIKEVLGSELARKKYEPLFPYFKRLKNSFRIIAGDFVTAEDGTGIVHTAPAFGEVDYQACKLEGIDFVQPVDKQGRFTNEVADFAGMYIKDADPKIIMFLKKQGKVVKVEKKAHEYPFCYRCETPLMYRAVPSWFVNVQKIKKRMLELNEKINWYPENLKHGRFQNNVETAPDWTISRNRYWASAMPVWECEKCKKIKVIGSIEELKKNAINLPKGKLDLHKDFLDNVKLKCECGKEMKRIPEVLDCWFESGSMPFAQFHYPFENKNYFEENFPAEFVAEYIAQTRAWFYYCLVMSSILFDDIPYKNIVTTGTILAEDGEKMSKSKGNFPDPWKLFEKYGVDALRFYLLSSVVMDAESLNFSEKSVDEIYKKVLLLLYNVNNFYSLSGKCKVVKPKSKNVLDKWILSRTNELIQNTTDSFEKYNTISACAEIKKFVDELSTWYVRRSRARFNENNKEAKEVLAWVLQETSKVIAPIMPFAAEIIYHAVVDEKGSVHLQEWPDCDKKMISKEITKNMVLTREIVSLALKERDAAKISLRQPLAMLSVFGADLPKEYVEIIGEEVNVKKVEMKKGKELKAELDTKMTPELEAEGFAREISRAVQAERKKKGLVKDDKIKLSVAGSKGLIKKLEKVSEIIKERTNSKSVSFTTEKLAGTRFKVKDEDVAIVFERI
jgi:isoleucyl-tRNA synthetase